MPPRIDGIARLADGTAVLKASVAAPPEDGRANEALRLAGDAAATDPVCRFSPHHDRVVAARESAQTDEFVYRTMKRPVRV